MNHLRLSRLYHTLRCQLLRTTSFARFGLLLSMTIAAAFNFIHILWGLEGQSYAILGYLFYQVCLTK